MKELTINIPDEANEQLAKMAIAVSLFDHGIWSSGQAAEFCGIERRQFLEDVGKYDISVFGEEPEDLEDLELLEL